jgi:DNA-binding XRE family transcriptional regulator
MDRRRKNIDVEAERALRDAFYEDIASHSLSIARAVKAMRRLSRLTQVEFAKHRGISLVTLKQLESGKGQPKIETLNKVGEIFGLEIAFVRKSKKSMGSE